MEPLELAQRSMDSYRDALGRARDWRTNNLNPYYGYYWTPRLANVQFWHWMKWAARFRSMANDYMKEHYAKTSEGRQACREDNQHSHFGLHQGGPHPVQRAGNARAARGLEQVHLQPHRPRPGKETK